MFRYAGISSAIAEAARASLRSPQYGHPAHRELATGTGPCRHCLRTFSVGQEARLLFTYQPFLEPGSLPAPGPVFIHADGCDRYDDQALPPDFRSLPIVVEGFASGGKLRFQQQVANEPPETVVERAFQTPGVRYLHLRNGEAGCFMARVDRLIAG